MICEFWSRCENSHCSLEDVRSVSDHGMGEKEKKKKVERVSIAGGETKTLPRVEREERGERERERE